MKLVVFEEIEHHGVVFEVQTEVEVAEPEPIGIALRKKSVK